MWELSVIGSYGPIQIPPPAAWRPLQHESLLGNIRAATKTRETTGSDATGAAGCVSRAGGSKKVVALTIRGWWFLGLRSALRYCLGHGRLDVLSVHEQ